MSLLIIDGSYLASSSRDLAEATDRTLDLTTENISTLLAYLYE
jgi:hypothetical protein